MVRTVSRRAGDCIKYPPSCASSSGRVDLLVLLYHKTCKKKSPPVRPTQAGVILRPPYSQKELNINLISHIQHFVNAFQPVSYRCPAAMGLCCNIRTAKPLNVPQKSYLSVNPPKRCTSDCGCHLLPVKSLQRSGQHYTSRRHK